MAQSPHPPGIGPQRFLLVTSSLAITEMLALLFEPVRNGIFPLGPILSLFVAAIVWYYSGKIISWWVAMLKRQFPLIGIAICVVLSFLVGVLFIAFMMRMTQNNVALSAPTGTLIGFTVWLVLRPKRVG